MDWQLALHFLIIIFSYYILNARLSYTKVGSRISTQGYLFRLASCHNADSLNTNCVQPTPLKSQSNIFINDVIEEAASKSSCHHGNPIENGLYGSITC